MTVSDILRRAKARITNESKWNKGNMALDSNKQVTAPNSPNAECWCAMGAIFALFPYNDVVWASDRLPFDLAVDALMSALPKEYVSGYNGNLNLVAAYNDSHTHIEVLALFDKAIEMVA